MERSFSELRHGLDNAIDSTTKCVHVLSDLLHRENGGRQSSTMSRIIDALGKWSEASPALVLRELEDIKRTCSVGADGANLSGTSESLVDTAKMAKILGVKKNWLYQRTRLNSIPFVKVGKYNRFYPSKVVAALPQKEKGEG